jgi:drug/metabolite transporter, DME family
MNKLSNHSVGVIMVAIAASLWALDGLLRAKLTFAIPTATIVFFEHLVGFVLLLPFVYKVFPKIFKFDKQTWFELLFLSLVSSVLGTILFTGALNLAFSVYDFATPILLQKLQPIFVVLLSTMFLRFKITWQFALSGLVALIGSYLVSFGFELPTMNTQLIVVLMSIGAALCWGGGTILSKRILTKFTHVEATGLRFLFAIPISLVFMLLLGEQYNFTSMNLEQFLSFVFIGLSTGAISIIIYYKGLQKISPAVSTFAELFYPIIGLLIAISVFNPYGEPQQLSVGSIVGIVILFIGIILTSVSGRESKNKA